MAFTLPKGAKPVERISLQANPSVPCIALHLARYTFAAGVIQPGSTVLDIACGTGYGSVLLASRPAQVVGVDISELAIAEARYLHSIPEDPKGCVAFVRDTAEAYLSRGLYKGLFDWIVSFETLEHVEDMGEALKLMLMLEPRAGLIFSVPHNEPEGSWPWHKTFGITKEKLEALIPLPWEGRFYGQDPQPVCTISGYIEAASDLIVVVRRS